MGVLVNPQTVRYELLLTTRTAISHHDPAVQTDSNRQLFNRQAQILERPALRQMASVEEMARIAGQHTVPVDMADIVQSLSFPEFVGTVLCRMFMDVYNSMDGSGLFSGMQRYSMLEERLHMAAIVAPHLRGFWDRLCDTMRVPIHSGEHDVALLDLLSLPMGTQQETLAALARDYRSLVSIARLWHTTRKLESESYAKKAGMMALVQPVKTLEFVATTEKPTSPMIVQLPAVSGNSLRHEIVREPSMMHLFTALGLYAESPGKGALPAACEALFYNGGNIEAGAKQPSTAHALAQDARGRYPSLDLLGGVTNSFDLGESRLRVVGYLVCAENRGAFADSNAAQLPNAQLSALDMLDDVTMTRQAGRTGLGQMIMSFETVMAGAQVLCRFEIVPHTSALTHGAFQAALGWYLKNDGTVGGQAARGFGFCTGEILRAPSEYTDAQALYEEYLDANREALVAGLCDGTLGTSAGLLG